MSDLWCIFRESELHSASLELPGICSSVLCIGHHLVNSTFVRLWDGRSCLLLRFNYVVHIQRTITVALGGANYYIAPDNLHNLQHGDNVKL